MTIQQAIRQWFKYKKTSDYQYVHASISPILLGDQQLRTMYKNAESNKQKECLLEHIERHKEITMQFPEYRTLKRRIEKDLAD